MIPYGRQEITQSDIDAVTVVLHSDYLTQGPVVPKFENEVASFVGAQHVVATNSATSALHIACLALGLGENDWLWTSPITFVASANCALYCGAQVDFVDIDLRTYNMSAERLAEKLERAEQEGKLPKIVVPVHLCGQSCDMKAIFKLSQRYGFKIIEDASHAIGGKYKARYIGGCHYSDITIFSFHPVKIITTGEGGMALTNNNELANKMELLRSHGITRDQAQMTQESDGPWYYQQIDLGFNYRMTDIQAALGASQINRLDSYIASRHALAERYNEKLSDLPVVLPWQNPECHSAYHLYIIRLHTNKQQMSHKHIFEGLRKRDIGVNLHYIPVHTQPYYKKMGFNAGDFPEAMAYYNEAITLPLFPTLTTDQQDQVISAVRETVL